MNKLISIIDRPLFQLLNRNVLLKFIRFVSLYPTLPQSQLQRQLKKQLQRQLQRGRSAGLPGPKGTEPKGPCPSHILGLERNPPLGPPPPPPPLGKREREREKERRNGGTAELMHSFVVVMQLIACVNPS